MEKRRVLIINSVSGIRSTGKIAVNIAENYMKEGYDCKIAFGRENVPEKYKNISYRIGTEKAPTINAIQARLFDNDGFSAKNATSNFIKWAEEYNPHILWLHNLHGYFINIEILFEWIKSRPNMEVKWTLHDCWAFTGHCAHFDYVKCHDWKTGCINCIQKKEYPKSIFLDKCKSNYRRKRKAFSGVEQMTIITPSKWLAGLVKESFLKDYPVMVVYNKIDDTVFKPTKGDFRQKYQLEDKKILLGVASAWSSRKGLNDFIRLSKLADDSFKIVLVGLTNQQIKHMPNNILCIERTNSAKELAEIYTAADVFLNLTYEDTYPTVNLEAQACGTPCITYRTGGSIESVPISNIVEQGDLKGIFEKVNELIDHLDNE